MAAAARIVITGTPGVGKHTAARLVSKTLGAELVDINKIALSEGLIAHGSSEGKGIEVDRPKLSRRISQLLADNPRGKIVVGHVAPYVVKRSDADVVVVLRRSPYDLLETLQKRGYSEEKARENVASEILGVVLFDSIKSFGRRRVTEIDTTGRTPRQTAGEIVSAAGNISKRTGRGNAQASVDWLSVVAEKGDVRRFFDHSPL
ncbi:MAG: adenylate kinase family protein [Nitrososphaera sp.]